MHVSYQAAHNALAHLTNNALQYEQKVYHQLPSYLQQLQLSDPSVYIHLETIPNIINGKDIHDLESHSIQRFHHVFISPSQAHLSFQHC